MYLNLWFTTVFSNFVGVFACDDPQKKVDLVNNFQQRASMSIHREYKREENSQLLLWLRMDLNQGYCILQCFLTICM